MSSSKQFLEVPLNNFFNAKSTMPDLSKNEHLLTCKHPTLSLFVQSQAFKDVNKKSNNLLIYKVELLLLLFPILKKKYEGNMTVSFKLTLFI